jgi:hypothetical protein
MSIADEIEDRVARGMLFPLIPKAVGAPIRRAMFVGEKLWNDLNSTEGDDEWDVRIGRLRADLEVFVAEEFVEPKYLSLLWRPSDAVWEIRSVRDTPSIRVLGLFALKVVFVSTNYALRETLGGWQSRAWREVKRLAKAVWRQLFNPYRPIVTSDVSDVITGAVDGKYFKH